MCGRISWLSRAAGAAVLCVSMVSVVKADTFGSGANQFTIDFVGISNATNPTSGYGIVDYDYRMGTYEITNDQWTKYCNVTGAENNRYWSGANVPTNEVSWYEAAQFVNWLNTSTGHQAAYKFTGTQGQGDYTLSTWAAGEAWGGTNLYRHKEAHYFLPDEDEWVKAAYWNGTGLQTWATPDDTQPVEDVEANYDYESDAQPWNVGSGSEELNGTFDMMGNVWEWMESPYSDSAFGPTSRRGIRGGSYYYGGNYLRSSYRNFYYDPTNEYSGVGFRVASVPEPASLAVLCVGALCLRRRKG